MSDDPRYCIGVYCTFSGPIEKAHVVIAKDTSKEYAYCPYCGWSLLILPTKEVWIDSIKRACKENSDLPLYEEFRYYLSNKECIRIDGHNFYKDYMEFLEKGSEEK